MICDCGYPVPMIETESQDEHGRDTIIYECVECNRIIEERCFED